MLQTVNLYPQSFVKFAFVAAGAHPKGGKELQGATPPNQNLKNRFCRHDDIKLLRDLPFSQNQPLKSSDDYYIRILENKIKKLWMSYIKFKKPSRLYVVI